MWERLADAEALRDANRRTGAAYLFGYAGEMAIKVKLFDFLGLAGGTPWKAKAGASSMSAAFASERARLSAAGHHLEYPEEGGHGLLLYGVVTMKSTGSSWTAEEKRQYCRRIWEANEHWCFGLRYWPGTASTRDLDRLAAAVWWLALN